MSELDNNGFFDVLSERERSLMRIQELETIIREHTEHFQEHGLLHETSRKELVDAKAEMDVLLSSEQMGDSDEVYGTQSNEAFLELMSYWEGIAKEVLGEDMGYKPKVGDKVASNRATIRNMEESDKVLHGGGLSRGDVKAILKSSHMSKLVPSDEVVEEVKPKGFVRRFFSWLFHVFIWKPIKKAEQEGLENARRLGNQMRNLQIGSNNQSVTIGGSSSNVNITQVGSGNQSVTLGGSVSGNITQVGGSNQAIFLGHNSVDREEGDDRISEGRKLQYSKYGFRGVAHYLTDKQLENLRKDLMKERRGAEALALYRVPRNRLKVILQESGLNSDLKSYNLSTKIYLGVYFSSHSYVTLDGTVYLQMSSIDDLRQFVTLSNPRLNAGDIGQIFYFLFDEGVVVSPFDRDEVVLVNVSSLCAYGIDAGATVNGLVKVLLDRKSKGNLIMPNLESRVEDVELNEGDQALLDKADTLISEMSEIGYSESEDVGDRDNPPSVLVELEYKLNIMLMEAKYTRDHWDAKVIWEYDKNRHVVFLVAGSFIFHLEGEELVCRACVYQNGDHDEHEEKIRMDVSDLDSMVEMFYRHYNTNWHGKIMGW